MKIYFWLFVVLLFACQSRERIKPINFVEQTVILKDMYEDTAFCKVNMFVPVEMDTLMQWIDNSDCPCCDEKKYRFTSSKGCLIQESGFIKSRFCQDSFWRLTVIHQCKEREELAIDSTLIKAMCNHQSDFFKDVKWRKKELTQINGQKFAVIHKFGHDYYSEKQPFEKIFAITTYEKTSLFFCIECLNQDCADFAEKANKIIQSIVIEPFKK